MDSMMMAMMMMMMMMMMQMLYRTKSLLSFDAMNQEEKLTLYMKTLIENFLVGVVYVYVSRDLSCMVLISSFSGDMGKE